MNVGKLIRVLMVATSAIALLGCASDNPVAAPDCLGDPSVDPATFPPSPEEEIARPDNLVDRRGESLVEIEIRDNVFDDEVRWLQVDPCTEIVFVNRGANPHNVVAAAEGAFATIGQDALFDGPQTLIIAAPGDYPYYCAIHGTPTRGQTGYLLVGDG